MQIVSALHIRTWSLHDRRVSIFSGMANCVPSPHTHAPHVHIHMYAHTYVQQETCTPQVAPPVQCVKNSPRTVFLSRHRRKRIMQCTQRMHPTGLQLWPETIDISMGAQAAARMAEPRECEHRHAIFPTLYAAGACVCVFTPRCVRPAYGPLGAAKANHLIN